MIRDGRRIKIHEIENELNTNHGLIFSIIHEYWFHKMSL